MLYTIKKKMFLNFSFFLSLFFGAYNASAFADESHPSRYELLEEAEKTIKNKAVLACYEIAVVNFCNRNFFEVTKELYKAELPIAESFLFWRNPKNRVIDDEKYNVCKNFLVQFFSKNPGDMTALEAQRNSDRLNRFFLDAWFKNDKHTLLAFEQCLLDESIDFTQEKLYEMIQLVGLFSSVNLEKDVSIEEASNVFFSNLDNLPAVVIDNEKVQRIAEKIIQPCLTADSPDFLTNYFHQLNKLCAVL